MSTVSPGVVQTGFGLAARHGGVDSRVLPGAQSAEEVAKVIADVIENPRADVYTRPGAREMIASYFAAEDMAAAEAGFPTFTPPRPVGMVAGAITGAGQPVGSNFVVLGAQAGPVTFRFYAYSNSGTANPLQRGFRGTAAGGIGLTVLGSVL